MSEFAGTMKDLTLFYFFIVAFLRAADWVLRPFDILAALRTCVHETLLWIALEVIGYGTLLLGLWLTAYAVSPEFAKPIMFFSLITAIMHFAFQHIGMNCPFQKTAKWLLAYRD